MRATEQKGRHEANGCRNELGEQDHDRGGKDDCDDPAEGGLLGLKRIAQPELLLVGLPGQRM